MNQVQAIKEYLLKGNSITSMEAIELFGCTRLSAKIHLLRKQGYDIVKIMRTGSTRFGTVAPYAVYKLKEVAK